MKLTERDVENLQTKINIIRRTIERLEDAIYNREITAKPDLNLQLQLKTEIQNLKKLKQKYPELFL